jgi:hypothetical protein
MEVSRGMQTGKREYPDRYFAGRTSVHIGVVWNKTLFADDLSAIALLRSLPSTYPGIDPTLFQR